MYTIPDGKRYDGIGIGSRREGEGEVRELTLRMKARKDKE